MSFGKRNRFLVARTSSVKIQPDEGQTLLLDVHGQVVKRGDRAVYVSILGKRFAFEKDGTTVHIEGRAYRLSLIDARESLVPI